MEKSDLIGRFFVNGDNRVQVVADPGGDALTVELTASDEPDATKDGTFGRVGNRWDVAFNQLLSGWNLV
jgi:hypothetical protein